MSKRVIKAWPYALALLVLAVIALFTEEYMPYDLFSNDENVEDIAPVVEDTSEVRVEIPVDTVEVVTNAYDEEIPEPVKVIEQKAWRLVVASVPNDEHAERIAASVGGGAEVKYVEYLDTYRVVYNSYSSLAEAQNGFDEISSEYPKAWLVFF